MDNDLKESEAIIAALLDQMLDASITGDFALVRKIAKKIHKKAESDKLKIN